MNLEIANRLVELRKAMGLSQEELAARLGVSRQAVSKWERCESSPDTDNLIALAKLYGISLDDLLLHTHSGAAVAVAYQVQEEPEPEPEPEPFRQEDEDAAVFATAAAWDAADEAAARKKRAKLKRALERFPFPIVMTILYLFLGFFFGWWHPGWMLFLLVPVYYCITGEL